MLSRRLLALSGAARGRIAGLVGVGLAITATYVGQGLLVARALGSVLAGLPLDGVVPLVAGVIGLQVLRALFLVVRDEQAMAVGGIVKEEIRRRLYARLVELGPGYTIRGRSGDVTSTMVDGVEVMERYFGGFVPQIAVALVGATAISAIIIVIDPVVGAIVAAAAALVPLGPVLSRRLLRPYGQRWWDLYKTLYADNLDALQGMVTLKAFGATGRRGAELHARATSFASASTHLTLVSTIFTGVVGLAESAGTALAVGVGALRFADGELDAAGLLIVLLLAREAFRPLTELQQAYHQAYTAGSMADGIFAVLGAEPEVDAAPRRVDADRRPILGPPSIVLEDVAFTYGPDAPQALDGLTLDIGAGETVALVGRSGAGKTTVVSLLLRFFDPQGGRILIGDRDVQAWDPRELRRLIAVVAQDTYLFHGTVADNLRLARPDASAAELETAARDAEAHTFIERLPDGYDTLIGERGLRLSGGERQRLAIARALLKDAPILVLDEATSSVDAASEAAIQQALDRLRHGRTVLIIAHRLSTVRQADRIVVMEAGRGVESGPHAELVSFGGVYARLVAAQAGAA